MAIMYGICYCSNVHQGLDGTCAMDGQNVPSLSAWLVLHLTNKICYLIPQLLNCGWLVGIDLAFQIAPKDEI